MKLNEIVIPNPACIAPTATLSEAAQEMKLLDVGILPVCENGRVVGMVTDRDITVRGVAQEIDPLHATVSEVMTEETVWCYEDQDILDAVGLMEKWQFRRLPVLNREERLVGIVSLGDLVAHTGGQGRISEFFEKTSYAGA